MVFPVAFINNREYKNNSERNRCQKYTQMFMNLKSFIDKDKYNEKVYVKEVSFIFG